MRTNSPHHMRHRRRAQDLCSLNHLVCSYSSSIHSMDPANSFLVSPFYASNAASTHNQTLPALAGLTGPPRTSPHQSTQRPPSSESGPPTQNPQSAPQGSSYSLPGISQTLQQTQLPTTNQANMDRERELREREARDREMMENLRARHAAQHEEDMKREVELRDREMRERQQEQASHENHSGGIQIHQPVAVAPSTRTIHGPNGLLGQTGPLNGPGVLAGPAHAPNAGIFGNAPVQQSETTPRMQHAVQAPPPPPQPQASMLMPFGGPPGQMGMGQGQQPILNVRTIFLLLSLSKTWQSVDESGQPCLRLFRLSLV
jgi:paired amphipathic helix protein Sin3a